MPTKWVSRFELKPGTWVFVPSNASIELGKEIKTALEARWAAPKNYYHLAQGGHVRALQAHIGNTHFVHLDIKNFFGQVSATRVTRCLKRFFSYAVARDYAVRSTVLDPSNGSKSATILPFGFVQSPILASVCLWQSALGNYLRQLEKSDITVSVYMDDIILSSHDETALLVALKSVETIAERSRLPLNQKKTEGPAPMITAFNIELSNLALNLTVKRLDEFKAKFRATDAVSVQQGILGYIQTVNAGQIAILTAQ